MSTNVLVLNADWLPIKTIPWQDAIVAILGKKATMVSAYEGLRIRSQNFEMEHPAVIVLNKFMPLRPKLRFNRANILARDGYVCQYCGKRPEAKASGKPNLEDLTIDHVVPRAQAQDGKVYIPWGKRFVPVTCWENVVTACLSCNSRKADASLEKVGYKLPSAPRKPTASESVVIGFRRIKIPSEWKQYLPPSAIQWAGYWEDELDQT